MAKPKQESMIVISNAKELPQDEDQNSKMIKKWLKKNKPSTRFKDEPKDVHVTPEGSLGDKPAMSGSIWRG